MGNLKLFNEHDTPPPVLFMQGSCIVEIGFFEGEDLEQVRRFGLHPLFEEVDGVFIAHVKVVDGSGDMLFHFDNNNKDPLEIAFRLVDEQGHYAGEVIFSSVDGGIEVSVPAGKKFDGKENDSPMNRHRVRFRCMREESTEEFNISGVIVAKSAASGSIPLYAVAFADLRSKGMELKVMLWFEPRNH